MRHTKKFKITFSILLALTLISCNTQIDITSKDGIKNSSNNQISIKGNIEFPKFNTKINSENKNLSIKATVGEVGNKSTVSLIYPSNHPTYANQTIVTGLSDENGSFILNPFDNFTPSANDIFILEASKRIGSSGSDLISVRTYIKWTGNNWQSITTPNLNINSNTTAITIIDYYNNSILPNDTINTINNGIIANINSISNVTISNVSSIVDSVFSSNRDPIKFISYLNNKYFISKEISVNKNYLISNKSCPNCELTGENISNQNLDSSDLSNAILSNTNLSGSTLIGADLSGSNLSNANLKSSNLSNANITGANISNTDFSNATWINGTTTCFTGSIGECLFPDIKVNTYITNNQVNPSIAMDSLGNYIVTWQSSQNSGYDVYAQRYNSSGIPQGSEFRVNTYTTGNQTNSSFFEAANNNVAFDSNGNFIIVWESENQTSSSSKKDIYGQRYNSNGNPQGSEFRINLNTINDQVSPSVAMDNNGNFTVVWAAKVYECYEIHGQRYNNVGVVQGSEFKVITSTTSIYPQPSLAMSSNGQFVISWAAYGINNGEHDIFAQRYNSSGLAQGSEFIVNTYTTSSQIYSSVGIDSTGNFVITWAGEGNNDTDGIYAQKYNSSGIAQGSEFIVNTYTTNYQACPRIKMNKDGRFVITWMSNGQSGIYSLYDIYTRIFDNNSNPQSSEFRVNSYTTASQIYPSIAIDATGKFVVAWMSNNQVSVNSSGDIYTKKYDNNGNQR